MLNNSIISIFSLLRNIERTDGQTTLTIGYPPSYKWWSFLQIKNSLKEIDA